MHFGMRLQRCVDKPRVVTPDSLLVHFLYVDEETANEDRSHARGRKFMIQNHMSGGTSKAIRRSERTDLRTE